MCDPGAAEGDLWIELEKQGFLGRKVEVSKPDWTDALEPPSGSS